MQVAKRSAGVAPEVNETCKRGKSKTRVSVAPQKWLSPATFFLKKKEANMEAISFVNGYFDFCDYNMWPQIWENNFVYMYFPQLNYSYHYFLIRFES